MSKSNSEWHKMDWEDTSQLQDHYFYLVTYRGLKTPMKAKWHAEMGGCWEVRGIPYLKKLSIEYWYPWEENNPIIAWMDIPDIYHKEDEV